jgi:NTP pyrophosphatase (non-canonical NTP hydrolase)
MDAINEITRALLEFRNNRNWKQFHNPKDLALALSIEASELNELFLWKRDATEWQDIPVEKISEELADVLAFAFLMAEQYQLDIREIVLDKIRKNGEKYPVAKSYNNATKYNKLK